MPRIPFLFECYLFNCTGQHISNQIHLEIWISYHICESAPKPFKLAFYPPINNRDELSMKRAIVKDHFKDCGWECGAILSELDASTDLYFDRVSQIKLGKWSRGRVVLIGDAAFCVSLLAGQGSALAMTAAYVMAGELAKSRGDDEVASAGKRACCALSWRRSRRQPEHSRALLRRKPHLACSFETKY
jgi:hypothetical protein